MMSILQLYSCIAGFHPGFPRKGPFSEALVHKLQLPDRSGFVLLLLIKFRYGERYLYIFSGFELIVTKSIPDLMEEDDAPLPEVDDSSLFDNLH